MFKIKDACGFVYDAYGTFVDEDGIVQFILADSEGYFYATNSGTNNYYELYEEKETTNPVSSTNVIKRIDFEVGCATSDGEMVKGTERGVTVLYNKTRISEEEVRSLISSGNYEWDTRVVVTTPAQADYLKTIK